MRTLILYFKYLVFKKCAHYELIINVYKYVASECWITEYRRQYDYNSIIRVTIIVMIKTSYPRTALDQSTGGWN